ncbi:MAG TPA: aminopeptidase P family protein [Verrucomicrobia bacterium]|nr:aminopeptidase P family protein [Verrucomicrobiota bacterium]
MSAITTGPPSLEADYCRSRQESFRGLLRDLKLDAAVLTHRHYVYWVTGYWHVPTLTPTAVFIPIEGPVVLVAHGDVAAKAADEIISYCPHKLCTLVENMDAVATSELRPYLQGLSRIGTDGIARPWLNDSTTWIDITTEYQFIRRKKYPDEVKALRHAVIAAEASYTKVREILKPGVCEMEMFASMQAASTLAAGEALSGWGNDFQIGTAGGAPRSREAEAGELAIFDVGVGVRGYRSDVCRTFAVNGLPDERQQEAHRRIVTALEKVESSLRPGLRCKDLFETMHAYLDGWKGYSFFHHLGHGIGLDGHEVPRLNPHWNDILEVGDVVAVEPALYGESLRGGIRLEQDFLVTESTVDRLSNFPLDL